jgi:predicted esterase YcpF (UPF0227 family)
MKDQSNILYIHGFASQFDPQSGKNRMLAEMGDLYGVNLDYTRPHHEVKQRLRYAISEHDIDVVVGTSLGGYWAGVMGGEGLPFIALNPAINPKETLRKYIGDGETYFGEPYHLAEEVLEDYQPFPLEGWGLILLDEGDEVLDSQQTKQLLDDHYHVIMYPGGTHRFAHIEEAQNEIRKFLNRLIIKGLGFPQYEDED